MTGSSRDREELKKMRRQEGTRDALLKEVEKGSRSMRLMYMRVEEIVKNVSDICREHCRDKGRFLEREHVLWGREASIPKDDSRKPTEDMKRTASGYAGRCCRQEECRYLTTRG